MSSDDDRDDHYWFNGHRHHSFWPNPSTYDRNSKIMLAAVVSLSAVIIFVFVLHLYARFVLRRRRETFRGLPVVVRHPFQAPKRGLDPTLIASLPSFTVGNVASATECAVCLSVLEEQDTARELPSCKHVFHVDCVDKWLTTCSTCPVCRTEVQPRPRLEPEPREGPVSDRASPPTAPPLLDDVLSVEAAASSSSDNKTGVSSVSRLDSFRRILTRERSSNRINQSCVDQDRVSDIESR
ncbi:E3 ubiquitin-protein ligase ATL41 [Hirschfeldia incana]|nr:E3 ubiquitin-protein ligase ATL41 [Hirschfeldia incana]